MKIDLHVHTAEHSICGKAPAVEMLRTARARGVEGVVITDHMHQLSKRERNALQKAVPGVRVFWGIELSVREPDSGRFDHVLVVTDEPCGIVNALAPDDVDRLAAFGKRTGALTILAHPFRRQEIVIDFELFTPDAIEIASYNTPEERRAEIEAIAAENGMRIVAGSDAHVLVRVGRYGIDSDKPVRTERGLARAIRAGAFRLLGVAAARCAAAP